MLLCRLEQAGHFLGEFFGKKLVACAGVSICTFVLVKQVTETRRGRTQVDQGDTIFGDTLILLCAASKRFTTFFLNSCRAFLIALAAV
jgi:hypothetical protein